MGDHMKKFFAAVLIFAMCAAYAAADWNAAERYSDGKSRDAVRAVAALGGIDCAAVLSRRGTVIAGILLEDGAAHDEISENARRLLEEMFPTARHVSVETDSELALDIIELSFFLDTDMDEKTLILRFCELAKRAASG